MKCPNCNYISEINFDICPNCGYNSNNSLNDGIVIFDGVANNNSNISEATKSVPVLETKEIGTPNIPVDVLTSEVNPPVDITSIPEVKPSAPVDVIGTPNVAVDVTNISAMPESTPQNTANLPESANALEEEEVEVGSGGYYNNVPNIPLMPDLSNIPKMPNQSVQEPTNTIEQASEVKENVNNRSEIDNIKEVEPVIVVPNPTINQMIPNEPIPQNIGMNSPIGNVPNPNMKGENASNNIDTAKITPKKKKRKLFLDLETIFIIILCIASAYAFITYLPVYLKYNNYKDKLGSNINLSYVYDVDRPILYKTKDGKYRYLNISGGNLNDKIYTYASEFYGDYAIVNTTGDEEYMYQFIDKNGDEILKIKELGLFYNDKNNNVYLVDGALYDNDLKRITEKNLTITYINNKFYKYFDNITKKEGIINSLGTILYEFNKTPYNYELRSISKSKADNYVEAYYLNGDKLSMEFISLSSSDTILKFDDANEYKLNYNDGLIEYYKIESPNEKKYMYLFNGEASYTIENVSSVTLLPDYNHILKINKTENDYEYYNANNKKTYKELDDCLAYKKNIEDYGYDLSYDKESGKVGLINSKNELIVEKYYDEIEFLDLPLYLYIRERGHSDVFVLKNRGESKIALYDASRKKVIAEYDDAEIVFIKDSTFAYFKVYSRNELSNHVVYNLLTNKELNVTLEETFSVHTNYFTVNNGKFIKYYNTRFNNFYSEKVGG